MRKRPTLWTLLIAAGLAVITLMVLGCSDDDDGGNSNRTGVPIVVEDDPTGTVTAPPRRTFTPTPTPSPTPLRICADNPNPAPREELQVEQPQADAKTTVPIHVRGWSSDIGEEGRSIFVSVVDQKQTVLQTNEVPPQPREFRVAPPGLEITEFTRPFGIDVVINEVEEEMPVCIWVFQDVDEDGQAQGVVQVPIVVEPR